VPSSSGTSGPLQAAVAGRYAVVVTKRSFDKDTGDVSIAVETHDVVGRRRVAAHTFFVPNLRDRSAWEPALPALLVATTGVAAFVVDDRAPLRWAVHRLLPRRTRAHEVLDAGEAVAPRSLQRIAGHRVRWVSDGRARLASLRRP